ncbi:Cupredoxin [Rhizophagus irregularis]|uniref:Cupredoxin n=4 Tax=Rhizophagus irregularis TaxID=588596 RepID=A0A2I1G3E9_9GLOM|nr:Cupredoxin [Rhizophagus irregularis DAOM 181602=DAOM 197198]EXX59723.1 hypothetical protein RirG_186540 [Rhizophagus irregularis DAOM 197198w]PKC06713.1 Cupredoxin [Rhizophagus irregularis]PKC76103.1 Cupredoxin [Rhizophagus irregularis]PKY16372.1 Cupredoxin [Rhizophagus irregularis]PKY41106.1 Cupredoxin [Rhizophagus irregularis]|eukprot:XP_025179200.1 Cupredoxin [Rhizophagus irregularis DAOM 181602=DAOM 197198]
MAQQKKIIRLCFALLLFITYVYAKNITVNVGGPGGVLKFDPQNVTDASQGDTIVWKFLGGNHNVVQSDGLASCDQSQTTGFFQSTTNPPTGTFQYTVQEAQGILYYFCSFASHCQNGMWGAIYVGGTAPASLTATTASPTSTAGASAVPSQKSSAVKFVGDFKLVTSATFIVLTLIKFLF